MVIPIYFEQYTILYGKAKRNRNRTMDPEYWAYGVSSVRPGMVTQPSARWPIAPPLPSVSERLYAGSNQESILKSRVGEFCHLQIFSDVNM